MLGVARGAADSLAGGRHIAAHALDRVARRNQQRRGGHGEDDELAHIGNSTRSRGWRTLALRRTELQEPGAAFGFALFSELGGPS
ncbi:hypothetical protein CC_1022 [Caulobacter vibrioides CB15]|uniref:Uncharacterized protein n=1 Tax=Caulobacter vibrioides (strain ATCC 19089 / CIP 103742 / CB 15) TaxID=190650 RepID=Q9A9G6_CAUVC|nr:hypothetical protein CC_1022 [Caulobacter vibrioides CB15]